ncbi:Transglycosylase SLT domain-containing protein [Caldanaerobius fijiensis DSM 17918]|uniref:Transglycosylase SLT domain-containing protein n=1 Tax=Caldanaerobius fijiensis DSM 17918 TaxID=1121256 RepID=A0A1M5BM23_9THEO|nr:M23 family metallopeptidase [Caldanaerobius fijiensis]SHF43574.1 Transglycosylase SLT domain-containing protein [Caldanaerobius fijiensis DSM 17918]
MNQKEWIKNYIKKRIWSVIWRAIAPYIGIIVGIAGVIIIFYVLIGAVYIQFTGAWTLTGLHPSPDDAKIMNWCKEAADKYNVSDIWYRPENGSYQKGDRLMDYYGRDKALILTWGMIYSGATYHNVSLHKEITKELIDEIAKDWHPTFKYVGYTLKFQQLLPETDENGRLVRDENGNVKKKWHEFIETRYVLEEADTIFGHFRYSYKKEKRTFSPENKGEELICTDTRLEGQPYERLDNYIKEKFKIGESSVDYQRYAIIEAGKGYDNKEQRMEWGMSQGFNLGDFVSSATIPPELIPLIQEVSRKYGIPAWFITGIIQTESSFNPMAINTSSGALGLMQVMPDNWKYYAPRLGYDVNADMFNPRAQLDVGTYLLKSYLGDNIDWSGDWKEQTLKALAVFGGYGTDTESCRVEYAEPKVWAFAESFRLSMTDDGKIVTVWPLDGYHDLSSPFGIRTDPITGKVLEDHKGIDIPAPMGTPVHAVASGQVVVAGPVSGYGNHVVVIRDMTHDYLYGHMSKMFVHKGEMVKAGDVIGAVGSEGRSTGPHLHLGISNGDWTKGNWIDPMLVLHGN